jgi:hypothetical protein
VEGAREDVDADDMSAEGDKGGGCRKPDARRGTYYEDGLG